MDSIKEQLPNLVLENMHLIKTFSAKTYKDSFDDLFKDYRPVFDHMEQLYLNAEDKESFVRQIADDFVGKVKEQYDSRAKKTNKESLMLDYNMMMSTYAIPCILEYRGESTEVIADALLQKWNDTFTRYKILKGRFADIDGSFKRKLCFITTAVCDSLEKPDDCYELTTLRGFRDQYMSKSEKGKALVEEYYRIAPILVMRMNFADNARAIYEEINESYIKPCVSLIEKHKFNECENKYTEMIHSLKDRFMGGYDEQ